MEIIVGPLFVRLTLCGQQVSADKRRVHVLQKYDALLRRYAEKMVKTVV